MAKENKNKLSLFALFLMGAVLLCAGWLMKSFPVFLFAGLAPLFALTDRVKKETPFWESIEWFLAALFISLFAAHFFYFKFLMSSIIQAIAFTFVWVAFGFARMNLGAGLGKFPLILFWLAIEYIFLKMEWPSSVVFLADGFSLKPQWQTWNIHTGYLGTSFWILVCNWILYFALFKGDQINWFFVFLFFVCTIGPVAYSYSSGGEALNRGNMIAFYHSNKTEAVAYYQHGEFIPRTAAWVSVLILLFAMVKNKIKKK